MCVDWTRAELRITQPLLCDRLLYHVRGIHNSWENFCSSTLTRAGHLWFLPLQLPFYVYIYICTLNYERTNEANRVRDDTNVRRLDSMVCERTYTECVLYTSIIHANTHWHTDSFILSFDCLGSMGPLCLRFGRSVSVYIQFIVEIACYHICVFGMRTKCADQRNGCVYTEKMLCFGTERTRAIVTIEH